MSNDVPMEKNPDAQKNTDEENPRKRNPRFFTPREMCRLQGFPENFIIPDEFRPEISSKSQSEALVKTLRDKKFKLVHKKDPNILDLQKDLEEKTGLNVSINNRKNNSGIITFEYTDLDQLDKLINTIKKNY